MGTTTGVSFVVLRLKDKTGKVISGNIYWLSKEEDYKAMNKMPATSVDVNVICNGKSKTENTWTVELTNPSGKLAFFIRPQLLLDGEEVLPSFWSGNYISLLPSEKTSLKLSCPVEKLGPGALTLKVSGWNVEKQEIILSK
jgi:hypothetical protein